MLDLKNVCCCFIPFNCATHYDSSKKRPLTLYDLFDMLIKCVLNCGGKSSGTSD